MKGVRRPALDLHGAGRKIKTMWTKIATMFLTSKKGQSVIAAVLAVLFVIVYSIMAAPKALLTGWFSSVFNGGSVYDNIDFDTNQFPAANHNAYIQDYNQFRAEFESTLDVPYTSIWKDTYDKSLALAKSFTDRYSTTDCPSQPCCTITRENNAIIYSTFSMESMQDKDAAGNVLNISERIDKPGIDGGFDRIGTSDAAAILSTYDNVGLEWETYLANDPVWEILKEMDVPKDASGQYIGELASVDSVKLVNLIKANAASFFTGHVPDSAGLCFPSLSPQFKEMLWDDLPRTYDDLKANPDLFQEPYGGIYYATKTTSHEHETTSTDADGNTVTSTYTCYSFFVEYTVIGFVEYSGHSWFEEHLHIDDFPRSRMRLDEIYRNMCNIVGTSIVSNNMLSGYTLGLDSSLEADAESREQPGRREYNADAVNIFPVVDADGNPFWVSAYFHDPNYVSDMVHWGIDFAAPLNTEIRVTSDGEVVRTGSDPDGFGNYVVVYQGKNADGDRFYYIYAHMNSISVSQGQMVTEGTQLGLSGSTGFSTGPHLHYECRVLRADGTKESIDPYPLLPFAAP